jgi:hypothetical protein
MASSEDISSTQQGQRDLIAVSGQGLLEDRVGGISEVLCGEFLEQLPVDLLLREVLDLVFIDPISIVCSIERHS